MLKQALIFIFGLTTLVLPASLNASGEERILDFKAEYTIQKDASVLVSENIKYDFGPNERRGIFRNIPIKYKTKEGTRYIKLEEITVTNSDGQPYNFTESRKGDDLEIKIGDPDIYISGVHNYKISYRVIGAMNYFDDHDEFYWNITGNSWPVNIEAVSAVVRYPSGSNKDNSKIVCYQGALGSTEKCQDVRTENFGERAVASLSLSGLESGQGKTFAAWFPKGLVEVQKPLTDSRVLLYILGAIAVLAGPIIAFWIMLSLWLKSGRDPKGKGAIVPEFTPPKGLTPTEAGVLPKDKVEKKSLSALLIYLATKGYLKINRIDKKGIFGGHDYEIEFLKPLDDKISAPDRQIVDELFGGQSKYVLGDLKKEKAEEISKIWKAYVKNTYDILTQKGVYKTSPDKIIKVYGGTAGGFATAAFLSFFFVGSFSWPFSISMGLIAAVVGIFAAIMPAKTVEGVALRDQALGLKDYMNVAEKDRMKILNAPKLNPQHFEALLPYAIALGVEKEWAKQFEGILTESPGWYNDPSNTAFNIIILNSVFDDFNGATNAAFAAGAAAASGSSGFGGGGFSGGGFGGGGGGSW